MRLFLKRDRFVTFLMVALCCLGLNGCVPGVARLPVHTVGMTGDKLEKQQLDLSFLQVGTTNRTDVLDKLNVINTGYSDPRLFWGRWFVSKWGYWMIGAGVGDVDRIWHANNLVVLFDEKGVVTNKKVVASDNELWSEITRHLQEAPKLDLSNPISMSRFPGGSETLNLRTGSMEMSGFTHLSHPWAKEKELPTVEVVPQNIIRISHGGRYITRGEFESGGIAHERPGAPTCHTLYFAEKTIIGKKLYTCMNASDLATLMRYLYQSHSGGMRWE